MKKLFFLLFTLVFSLQAAVVQLHDNTSSSIESAIEYLEDPNGNLSLKEVQKSSFTPYAKERSINFGFTDSAYWFKINLKNLTPVDDIHWWLKIDYPLLELIDFYLMDSNGRLIKHKRTGTSQPFTSREVALNHFIIEIPMQHKSDATLWIRVKTQSSMQLLMTIMDTKTLLEDVETNHFLVGIYYGIFIIIFFYNVVLLFYSKDKNYLRYIFFLLAFVLWQLSFDGHGIQYVWGNNDWLIQHGAGVFISLSAFFALYFSRHFLNTSQYTPSIDRVMLFFMFISLILVVASSVFPYGKIIPLNALLGALMPAVALFAGITVMRQGYKAARFYIAGWSTLLIATIIFAFNKFDLIPSFYGINHVQQIGSAIEMIFLSLALAHRVYLLQREYIEKLNYMNDTLSDKVKIALDEARLKDRLFVQQSRLAAMGEMIEQIAHQWRQPLHTLALINQDMYVKLKLGTYDEVYFDQYHTRIDEYLQYLSKTIDDFRNFYKADKSKALEDVGDLVTNALNLSDVFLKYAKIKTEMNVSTKQKVNIAKNEMIQVLINLIKNAHDAILEQKINDGKIIICVEDYEAGIKVSVEDNAGGISQNIMDKVFDIYFTTKDPDCGTGLGLHMSKYIIEESFSGKILVENTNSGAKFVILLPCIVPQVIAPEPQ